MKKAISSLILLTLLIVTRPVSSAPDNNSFSLKDQERYTVSLALEFRKKNQNSLERVLNFLNQAGPNGFATGFFVGPDLVMTSYHVVSGELADSKKRVLGFSPQDQLDVK